MTRIDPLRPADLTADQRALYDSIVGGPRAKEPQSFDLTTADGELRGPFNALLLSPPVGDALQRLGAAIRYSTGLSPREREIAILTVASYWNSEFELMAHTAVGRTVGLTDDEMTEVVNGQTPPALSAGEQACLHLTRSLLAGDVGDQEWNEWAGDREPALVFELTTLVGYYATLALQLRVFRVLG